MEIQLVPEPGDQVAAAVALAVSQVQIDPSTPPAAYGSIWRHRALIEGVERETDAAPGTFDATVQSSFRRSP